METACNLLRIGPSVFSSNNDMSIPYMNNDHNSIVIIMIMIMINENNVYNDNIKVVEYGVIM